MDPQDFDCFRMAFDYVQRHRFAKMGSVEEIHLVGPDGNLDHTFEQMVKGVYRAIRQARERTAEWQGQGFPDKNP